MENHCVLGYDTKHAIISHSIWTLNLLTSFFFNFIDFIFTAFALALNFYFNSFV